jgi:hypothetical protein
MVSKAACLSVTSPPLVCDIALQKKAFHLVENALIRLVSASGRTHLYCVILQHFNRARCELVDYYFSARNDELNVLN